jgi:hypothetical protein
VLRDGEIPELVLQHDRHVGRILLAHARGEAHAGVTGVKADIEVMFSRQAARGGIHKNAPDDLTQGILGQKVVADMILGRLAVGHGRQMSRMMRPDPSHET